jgi:cytidylate kinase
MFLSRQEKERLVLDLYYNQGKTFRDIAKEVRMSFSDISGRTRDDNNTKQVSRKSYSRQQQLLKERTITN